MKEVLDDKYTPPVKSKDGLFCMVNVSKLIERVKKMFKKKPLL